MSEPLNILCIWVQTGQSHVNDRRADDHVQLVAKVQNLTQCVHDLALHMIAHGVLAGMVFVLVGAPISPANPLFDRPCNDRVGVDLRRYPFSRHQITAAAR